MITQRTVNVQKTRRFNLTTRREAIELLHKLINQAESNDPPPQSIELGMSDMTDNARHRDEHFFVEMKTYERISPYDPAE